MSNDLKENWSFESFKASNKPNFFGAVDYIYGVFNLKQVPMDLLLTIVNIVYPDFHIIDECIFIVDIFDSNKYVELQRQGLNKQEIQFWMNSIEITSLHEDLSDENALLLANKIASSWNAKIKYESITATGSAKVIDEVKYGEVYVTID